MLHAFRTEYGVESMRIGQLRQASMYPTGVVVASNGQFDYLIL
jgi:hypothetical protein